jgi:multiple sugar transport system permease protein
VKTVKKALARNILWHFSLLLGAIVIIFPIIYMFSASFMPLEEVFSTPVRLWPSRPRLLNYGEIFTKFSLHRYFLNSVVLTIFTLFCNIFFCSLVGYSLAKFKFPGRDILFTLILATMMIPSNVIVIPLYLLIRSLGWVNSFWGLSFPHVIAPFGVFLMRQFIRSIPDDYIDAARIDGCSEFKIFYRIIMPLSLPAIATLSVVTFVNIWNLFLWPLIVITSDAKKTLPIALNQFLSNYANDWNLLMAASVIATSPILLFFFVFNRGFIEGMTGLSGLKE